MNNNQGLTWAESSAEDSQKYEPKDVFSAGKRNYQIANTAYPINHNETIKPYKVPENKLQEHVAGVWSDVDDLLLYAHVPFCERICAFCELSVVKPKHIKDDTEPYFKALETEINMYGNMLGEKKYVSGFDIGGGTPSLVDTKHIGNLIDTVDKNFERKSNMHMSIETTPKIAAEELQKVRDYYTMGIRRISMGVQSLSGKLIGRRDTSAEDNIQAIANMRKAGFEQVNVDVMYGFANQETTDVVRTIEHILELDPEFVTLYPMRYKGTVIEGKSADVVAEKLSEQYGVATQMLSDKGYDIRPGKNTCSKLDGNDGLSDYLHHRVLHGKPYLGFGLGAQSFNPSNNLSYNHGAHIKHNGEYIQQVNQGLFPIQDAHNLGKEAAIAKMVAISFFYGGIHLDSFKNIFNEDINVLFKEEIQFIKDNELMQYDREAGILQLTQKGVENFSGMISLFYNPSVKKYLIDLKGNEWMGKSQSIRDMRKQ